MFIPVDLEIFVTEVVCLKGGNNCCKGRMRIRTTFIRMRQILPATKSMTNTPFLIVAGVASTSALLGRFRKIRSLASIALLPLLLGGLGGAAFAASTASEVQPLYRGQPDFGVTDVPIIKVDGLEFKDLNRNGKLDPYEDWRRPVVERVQDLLSRMTLEEKAGLMVSPTLAMGSNGTVREEPVFQVDPFIGGPPVLSSPSTSDAINSRHIRQFIIRVNANAKTLASWLNGVQRIAENSRLGIPAFFVTNPRNHISGEVRLGINEATGNFSQWPGTLGLAATRDPKLVEEFGAIAAQEYVSVGIRGAYHPQADVATEPRWARISGTFGEDAYLTASMVTALLRGFQGPALGPKSVALAIKHFPGAGPEKEGQDAHFAYGKYQVYPGNNLSYHLIPFQAAIAAGAVTIIPYYAIPHGLTNEEVGMAYNRQIIQGLLRDKLGFSGIVNSDSGITTSMPWGVENLSIRARYKKAIDAGTDIISNDVTPNYIVDLVRNGELSEERINESVTRILRVRFSLGIFENSYADPANAAMTVGCPEFQGKADVAQRKSIVLLKNSNAILPLRRGLKVYSEGLNLDTIHRYGYTDVGSPKDADCCLILVTVGKFASPQKTAGTPIPVPDAVAGPANTHGAKIVLTIPDQQLAHLLDIIDEKPTIVVVNMDRPYVIPEISERSAALLATFGVSESALLDVIAGVYVPTGKLPFEMPSSMSAVEQQLEDVPFDSRNPLYHYGAGLTYPAAL